MTEHERKEYIKNKYKQRKALKKQNHLEKEENEPRSPTIKCNVSSDKAVPNTSKIDVIERKKPRSLILSHMKILGIKTLMKIFATHLCKIQKNQPIFQTSVLMQTQ